MVSLLKTLTYTRGAQARMYPIIGMAKATWIFLLVTTVLITRETIMPPLIADTNIDPPRFVASPG